MENSDRKIGKYRGIPVYAVLKREYIDNKYYDNKSDMFIISDDGNVCVLQNLKFGTFDGKGIKEFDNQWETYYKIVVEKTVEPVAAHEEPSISSTSGFEVDDVPLEEFFKRYTKEVDTFMENLGVI